MPPPRFANLAYDMQNLPHGAWPKTIMLREYDEIFAIGDLKNPPMSLTALC